MNIKNVCLGNSGNENYETKHGIDKTSLVFQEEISYIAKLCT